MTVTLRRRFLCLMLLACAAGCTASRPPTTRPVVRDDRGAPVSQLRFPPGERQVVLPLEFDGALLTTDAIRVNGQDLGPFVIDTGAAFSVLDREAAVKAGLTPDKRWRDLTKNLPAPDGLYRIDSLDAGGVGVRNHVIAVLDLAGVNHRRERARIAGVIGADVWAMTPFSVDYRAREVTFYAREHFRPPTGDQSVESPLSLRRHPKLPAPFARANPRADSPTVPARINGEGVDVTLDTASGSSIVLMPRLVNRHPHWVRGDRAVARAAGAGGAVGLDGIRLLGANVESVDLLGVRFTDIRGSALAIIDDLPRDHGSAIVGSRLLQHLRLTFDYATGKVWAEVNVGAK